MEAERQGDIRVPLISACFCLFVIAGGVFLIIYVYVPDQSQPWYPIVALVLIGSPWVFWLMAYTYTCMKAIIRARRMQEHQLSKPSALRSGVNRTGSQAKNNGDDDGKHVRFEEVVVMTDEQNTGPNEQNREEASIAARESQVPLNISVSS